VAGAPFFFGEAEAVALGLGVSLGLGEAEADSSGDGVGVGELLRFFFLLDGLPEDSGVGVGEDFFFFADEDGLGLGVAEGVGLAAAFFFGDGEFSPEGVGDSWEVDFFFRCFRGVGVGVGARIFLSLVPNDSSAGARTAVAPIVAATKRASAILIVRCIASRRDATFSPARPGPLCSAEFRSPNSRAENFRSANERGNPAAPGPLTKSRRQ